MKSNQQIKNDEMDTNGDGQKVVVDYIIFVHTYLLNLKPQKILNII